jgi:hypothetical protein
MGEVLPEASPMNVHGFFTEPVAYSLYARREQLVLVYDIGLENNP